MVVVGEDGAGSIAEALPEMDPKTDDAQTWVGQMFKTSDFLSKLDPTRGAVLDVYASAHKQRTSSDTHAPYTDMKMNSIIFHQVTPNRGSNGIAGVNGNGANDAFAVEVPAGAYSRRLRTPHQADGHADHAGLAGSLHRHHRAGLPDLAPHLELERGHRRTRPRATRPRCGSRWRPTCSNGADQPMKLTVRRWSGTAWSGDNISHVEVTANVSGEDTTSYTIRFKTKELSPEVWAVVATDKAAPVEISASPAWSGYTDQDPILRGIIRSTGDGIDYRQLRVLPGRKAGLQQL